MKSPIYQEDWPESWKLSYFYDLMEVYNQKTIRGYCYSFKNRFHSIINSIKKNLPSGSNILDIAAAQGNFSLKLAELNYNLTWNDLRGELVDYVKLKHEKGQIDFVSGNAFEVEFKDKFDAVIITEIIEHVAHPDEFLIKVSSLVKPGGYIFMSTPLGNYFLNSLPRFSDCDDPSIFESVQFKPNSDGHIFLLHYDELNELAKKASLSIEEIKIYNNFITSGHLKTKHILKLLPATIVNGIEKFTQKFPLPLRLKIHNGVMVVFKKNG